MTFSAAEAVSLGLADSIGTLEDATAEFSADMSNQEDDNMFTQEQLDAAVATATASAKADGIKEGANTERTRFAAIVNSEAGQARPKAAMEFATSADFSAVNVEAITGMLSKLPEEKAAAPAPKDDANKPKGKDGAAADFNDAMNKADHPEVGTETAVTQAQQRKSRIRGAAGGVMQLRQVK